MHTDTARLGGAQPDVSRTTTVHKSTTYALFAIAALAGAASLWTSLTYGLDRAGLLGAAVGAACALGCLLGPRLLIGAIKSRDATRALAAALMLVVAIPVAVSGALGAAATARDQAARLETKATGDRARQQAAYDRSTADLARLPSTRPVPIIEADLAAILKDTRLNDCAGWLESTRLRTVCIERVEPARKELAMAQERARVSAAVKAASLQLSQLQPGKPASLDAASLARLAGRLGVRVTAEQVTDALLVLLVAATELMGGLALALAGSDSARGGAQTAHVPNDSERVPPAMPVAQQLIAIAPESVESAAIEQRLAYGPLIGRQRDLAAMFNLPVTTFRRRLESMPNVRLIATTTGSRLELKCGHIG